MSELLFSGSLPSRPHGWGCCGADPGSGNSSRSLPVTGAIATPRRILTIRKLGLSQSKHGDTEKAIFLKLHLNC